MRVYHSSTQIIEFPAVKIKNDTKDFSWGFYCTNDLTAVRIWSKKIGRKPIINVYEYKEDTNLNILCFEKMTDEWLDFIMKCRKGFVHHYDVVIGPMLDALIKNDVESFFKGDLSRVEFWESVQSKQPIKQISFHTIRALTHLKYIGSEILH